MPCQAPQEAKEGVQGDAELPPEQLLPGMQHLSVTFEETVYRGGDECEGPQGRAERQVQVKFPSCAHRVLSKTGLSRTHGQQACAL